MLDVVKYSRDQRLVCNDPEGHLSDLESWSPKKVMERAAQEGITLTEDHWAVLFSLREHVRQEGVVSARRLGHELEREFGDGGGRRRLYELFPRGPVLQGCRIAGLPPPAHGNDPGFGSVC